MKCKMITTYTSYLFLCSFFPVDLIHTQTLQKRNPALLPPQQWSINNIFQIYSLHTSKQYIYKLEVLNPP